MAPHGPSAGGSTRARVTGMGLLDRFRGGKKADDWVAAQLHVVDARRPTYASDQEAPSGYTPYTFDLEVRREGAEPYRVAHSEKVPRNVLAQGLMTERKIPNGIDLTGWVRVDDPNVVAVDWTSYRTIEARASVENARQVEDDAVYARAVIGKASPKMQAQLRASGWTTVSMHAEAVRAGAMTRDDWERYAMINLRRTLITQEQYDAAAASIDGIP